MAGSKYSDSFFCSAGVDGEESPVALWHYSDAGRFVLFHDCCHGSFFRSRRANDFLGFFLGVIVLTPYKFWRKSHAIHHAQSGKLEGRGIGDITTMTVQEYRDSRPAKRFMYRVFRNPILQFLIAPALYFGIYYRFTQQYALSWKEERKSVMLTNAVLALFIGVLVSWIGWQDFLWLFIPTFMITTSAGVWLFYVQHQYEHTYWRPESEWEYFRAAVHGASFYKLPRVLQWFTANIGFHHVHHLNPRIPNYRLKDCHEANEFFESAEVLTFWKSLRMMFLLLWDEQQQRMITLAEYKKRSVTV